MITIPSLTYTLNTAAFPEGLTYNVPEVTVDIDDIAYIHVTNNYNTLPDGTIPGNRVEIYFRNKLIQVPRIEGRTPDNTGFSHWRHAKVLSTSEENFDPEDETQVVQIQWPEWLATFLEENGYRYHNGNSNPEAEHRPTRLYTIGPGYIRSNDVDIFNVNYNPINTELRIETPYPNYLDYRAEGPIDFQLKDMLYAQAFLTFQVGAGFEDSHRYWSESPTPLPDRVTIPLGDTEEFFYNNWFQGRLNYGYPHGFRDTRDVERNDLIEFVYNTGVNENYPRFDSTVEAVRIGNTTSYKVDLSTLVAPPVIKAFFEYNGFDSATTVLGALGTTRYYTNHNPSGLEIYGSHNIPTIYKDFTFNLEDWGRYATIAKEGFNWDSGAATYSHLSTNAGADDLGIAYSVEVFEEHRDNYIEVFYPWLDDTSAAIAARDTSEINITINNAAGGSLTPFTELAPFYQDRVRSTVERVLMETDGVTIRQWALESDLFHTSLETMDLNELVDILSHVALVGR